MDVSENAGKLLLCELSRGAASKKLFIVLMGNLGKIAVLIENLHTFLLQHVGLRERLLRLVSVLCFTLFLMLGIS